MLWVHEFSSQLTFIFSEGWLSHQPVHDDFENGIRISPFFHHHCYQRGTAEQPADREDDGTVMLPPDLLGHNRG
jgi:hypothetical protein